MRTLRSRNTLVVSRGFFALLPIALLCLFARSSDALTTTGNKYVVADVQDGTGLISFFTPPGRNGGKRLAYVEHSYLSLKINNKVFTNNDVQPAGAATPSLYGGAEISKIGDTIRAIWRDREGVDIIQDVYPVEFTESGQIVIKIKALNKGGGIVSIAAQYLLDTAPNNDNSKVLTRFGYRPNYAQFPNPNNSQIPPFYATFEKDLPNSPSFDPGVTGVGFTEHAVMGLKVPFRMTIGHWPLMNTILWGPPSPLPNTTYGDSGILLEWSSTSIQPGKEVELGRTSYGTAEFSLCIGKLFAITFYQKKILCDGNTSSPGYKGNPFKVETYLFNYEQATSASNTKMTLEVGPQLQIVSPLTGKQVSQDAEFGGTIQPLGVAYFRWDVKADVFSPCSQDMNTYLKLTASSSLGPPSFTSDCEMPLSLECCDRDMKAPVSDNNLRSNSFPYQETFKVHDNSSGDVGLDTIYWSGKNLSNLVITVSPGVVKCDRNDQLVTVVQKDSTIDAFVEFTFVDCAGNRSNWSVDFKARLPQAVPDTVRPKFTLIDRRGSSNGTECNALVDSLLVTDDLATDEGIESVTILSNTNMVLNLPAFTKGASRVRFSVSVVDRFVNGTITVRAKDVAGNFADTTFTYCTIEDVEKPIVTVTPTAWDFRGVAIRWTVYTTELQNWDRLIDSVGVEPRTNIMLTPPTLSPRGKSEYTFEVAIKDTFSNAMYCVWAADLAKNVSKTDCFTFNAHVDSAKPNIVFDPLPTSNPTCIDVMIDDIHPGYGFDTGIDSVWFEPNKGMTVSIANTGYTPTVSRVPKFTICVTDTNSVEDVACVTVHARDSIGNHTSKEYCYPYQGDQNSPFVQSTQTTNTFIDLRLTDSQPGDRGLRSATILAGATNWKDLDTTIAFDSMATVRVEVVNDRKSAFGEFRVIDRWGSQFPSPDIQAQHSVTVPIESYVQDFEMRKSHIILLKEVVTPTSRFSLPVTFIPEPGVPLVNKGIREYKFRFELVGDDEVQFLDVETIGTASVGWVPAITRDATGKVITVILRAQANEVLQDDSRPLVFLNFEAQKTEETKSVEVRILSADPNDQSPNAQRIVLNNGENRLIDLTKKALVQLPPPHGTLSGSRIVFVGTCSPDIKGGLGSASMAYLYPPRPNPVTNRTTTVEYSISAAGYYAVTLHDNLGAETGTVVAPVWHEPGKYSVNYDASRLAQGMYYLRLSDVENASRSTATRSLNIQR